MENKYQNGKIYKIISKEMPGLVYYGSTNQTLKRRMTIHASPSNTSCSKLLFGYGIPEIILIKDYPCNSRKELEIEEGKYHRGNECINKNVAGRTDKEYREDNKDKISEQSRVQYDCECGGKYTRVNKSHHIKTQKHQEFISSKIV
tara:strand:+ start:503 stop:940 length:438 start_codon:yes stop_codon:yes gene_type:complete